MLETRARVRGVVGSNPGLTDQFFSVFFNYFYFLKFLKSLRYRAKGFKSLIYIIDVCMSLQQTRLLDN